MPPTRSTSLLNRKQRKKLYGIDQEITAPFGRQCLMARRLVERGVRFVQLFHGGMGNQNTDTWDAHSNLEENHRLHAAESDLPISGLLTDLKAHGLLDTTLVLWHGEFGRLPISQRGVGRDHNPGTMTAWMAGAGIRGGQVIGSSDEFWVQGVGAADFSARSARHDPASLGYGSREADVSIQWSRHSSDRCGRYADTANHLSPKGICGLILISPNILECSGCITTVSRLANLVQVFFPSEV